MSTLADSRRRLDYRQGMRSLRSYLELARRLRGSSSPAGLHYSCPEDLLLREADAFRGRMLPPGLEPGPQKACFFNSQQLAFSDPSLTYYEGYTTTGIGLPIHHAWCIDGEGQVVEATLRFDSEWQAAETAYLGVGFSPEQIASQLAGRESLSLLENLEQRHPLLHEPFRGPVQKGSALSASSCSSSFSSS